MNTETKNYGIFTFVMRSRDSLPLHVQYYTLNCKAIAACPLSSWQEFGGRPPLSTLYGRYQNMPAFSFFRLSILDFVSRARPYRRRTSIVLIVLTHSFLQFRYALPRPLVLDCCCHG